MPLTFKWVPLYQCSQLQRRKIQNRIDSAKEMTMHVTMGKWMLSPSRTI